MTSDEETLARLTRALGAPSLRCELVAPVDDGLVRAGVIAYDEAGLRTTLDFGGASLSDGQGASALMRASRTCGAWRAARGGCADGWRPVAWLFHAREVLGRLSARSSAPRSPGRRHGSDLGRVARIVWEERARAIERVLDPGSPTFVVRRDGALELATVRSEVLRSPGALEVIARAFARSEPPETIRLGFLTVDVQRVEELASLRSPGERFVLTFRRARPQSRDDGVELPERRLAVARLAADGLRIGEIAELLRLSPNTVKTHLRLAYEALDVGNRAELVHVLVRTSGHR